MCSILRTWPKFTHMTSCTSGGSSSKRSRAPSHWCETCKNARFEWSSIGPMMHTSYSRALDHVTRRTTLAERGGEGGERDEISPAFGLTWCGGTAMWQCCA